GPRKPAPPGTGRRCRPVLEQLEDRWVPAQFTNPTAITIPSVGPALQYPSAIVVSGFAGAVTKVTVTLHDFFHTLTAEVDVLLVAPNGANATILSDVGNSTIPPVTLTLDDAAAEALPAGSPLTSGTFRPTNVNEAFPDTFPAPAPAPSGG